MRISQVKRIVTGHLANEEKNVFELNKDNRDRLVDRERDDSCGGGRLGGGAIEQKGKRAHGHG